MGLRELIDDRDGRVGIVGMGYVGLPLARAFLEADFAVTGFDIDPDKVADLNAGRSYIRTVPTEEVAAWRAGGRFEATGDPAELCAACDAVLICVPTPLTEDRDPDLSYVRRTAETLAARLRPGMLVVLESTTYPGTTDEVVLPILEEGSGMTCGRDFFLAYSPEREDPGNPDYRTASIPKVVGGVDPESGRIAADLYAQVVAEVVPVRTSREAEAAKILENIYRAVNIALVNELKVLFDRMDVDVWEVIEAAATKPFGFQAFRPGPGLGGHCIPIDPFYLAWKARQYGVPTRFIELAGDVNAAMPDFVMAKLRGALEARDTDLDGARVLVLGVAYKPGVDDVRESPALVLIERLQDAGAEASYHDPHVPHVGTGRHYDIRMDSVDLTDEALRAADCVLIATDHPEVDYARVVREARLVVDSRNACGGVPDPDGRVVRA